MKLVASSSSLFSVSLGGAFWVLLIAAPLGSRTATTATNAEYVDGVGGGRVRSAAAPPRAPPSYVAYGGSGREEEYGPMEEDYNPEYYYSYDEEKVQEYPPPPPFPREQQDEGRPMRFDERMWDNEDHPQNYDYNEPPPARERGEGPLEMVASNNNYYSSGTPQQVEEQSRKGSGAGVRGGSAATVGRTPPGAADAVQPQPGSIEAQIGHQSQDEFIVKVWAPRDGFTNDHFIEVYANDALLIGDDDLIFKGYTEDGDEYYEGIKKAFWFKDCIEVYTKDNTRNGFAGFYIEVFKKRRLIFKVDDGTVYCQPEMGCGDGTNYGTIDYDQRNAQTEISYPYAPKIIQYAVNDLCIED